LLARVRARLQPGGPAVDAPVLLAFIDDQKLEDPAVRTLTEQQHGKLLGLIARYKDWFDAYCDLSDAADEDDALSELMCDWPAEQTEHSKSIIGLTSQDGTSLSSVSITTDLPPDRLASQEKVIDTVPGTMATELTTSVAKTREKDAA